MVNNSKGGQREEQSLYRSSCKGLNRAYPYHILINKLYMLSRYTEKKNVYINLLSNTNNVAFKCNLTRCFSYHLF